MESAPPLSTTPLPVPPCRYFGTCGGCQTQHISYETQLKNKKRNVASFLKIPEERIVVHSDTPFGYRNRMDFIFQKDGLGLRSTWNKLIDVESCPIANTGLNALLVEVRAYFRGVPSFDVIRNKGLFRYAVIRTPKNNSSITFILNEDSPTKEEAVRLIKIYAAQSTAQNIIVGYVPSDVDLSIATNTEVVKGSLYLTEEILGKEFTYHSQSFFQNNTAVAELMVAHVQKLLAGKKGHLLDFYGGVGLFGISCMSNAGFDAVTIVENSKESIDCATLNLEKHHISGKALVMDANAINRIRLPKPLHVINDPPRSGMHPKAIERLLEHRPETIVYISCNPQQLGKELPRFIRQGYVLQSCDIFDMFPQTNHIECVVLLERPSP